MSEITRQIQLEKEKKENTVLCRKCGKTFDFKWSKDRKYGTHYINGVSCGEIEASRDWAGFRLPINISEDSNY